MADSRSVRRPIGCDENSGEVDDGGQDAKAPCQAPKRLMSAADLVEAKRRKFVSYPRSGLKDRALVEAPGEKEDDSPPLDDLIK